MTVLPGLPDLVLAELRTRLAADHDLIAAAWHPDGLGPLVAVRPLGDPHRGGRRVAALDFAGGRSVIYKPRPVGPERWWADLLAWLGRRGPPASLRAPQVLDRTEYGWVEWIAPNRADTPAAIERFGRRAGALLALLDVFEVRDAHAGNVIGSGDEPVLVDAETIAHPRFAPWADADSLVLTGFLPWRDLVASGPAGAGSILTPVDRDAVGGSVAWAEMIVVGYREGYRLLERCRAELLSPAGPLVTLAGLTVRVVLRASRHYAGRIGKPWPPPPSPMDIPLAPAAAAAVVAAERKALARGDIPVLFARAGGRDLVTEDGVVPEFFGESAVARITRRLVALGDQDLDRNTTLIRSLILVSALASDTATPGR